MPDYWVDRSSLRGLWYAHSWVQCHRREQTQSRYTLLCCSCLCSFKLVEGSRERTRWWDALTPTPNKTLSKPHRVVGTCTMLGNTYLPRQEVLVSGIYDATWANAKHHNAGYNSSSFRVIEPTKFVMDSALESLLDHEPGSISQEIYDIIVDHFPVLKGTTPVVTISKNPSLDLDPLTFTQAIRMYRDYVLLFYCPQQLLADSIQNLDSSSGPQAKILGLHHKRDLVLYDYDYAMDWCRGNDPLFFGIAGKTELIKERKYKNGIIRPFEPQDARSHFECAFQFGGSNTRMAQFGNVTTSPIAIGFVQQRNYIELMTLLRDQLKIFSGDAEGWDKRFEQLFQQLEFGWRLDCAISHDYMTLAMEKGSAVLTALYQRIFSGYATPLVWYSPGGFLVKLFIQPSGSTNTSYTNSTGHSFIHFYHYSSSRQRIGHKASNLQDFKRDIFLKIYGDDNLGAVKTDERLVPFYSFEERAKTYRLFSQYLKYDDDRYTDSPEGHTWLGFKCDLHLHPRYNVEKAFCSMHWPTGPLSPEERYMKCVCIMLNCAYEPMEVYGRFSTYLANLMQEHPDASFPSIGTLSKSLIPTQRELRNFWVNGESSIGWLEVFEEKFHAIHGERKEKVTEGPEWSQQARGKGPQTGSQDTGESNQRSLSAESGCVSDQDS